VTFWVYILRCRDGSYYVGSTDDLEWRLGQHDSGEVPGWTQRRRPVHLAYSRAFDSRDDAKVAERQLKGWSRAKKEALIGGDAARLSALSRRRGGRPLPS